MEMKKINYMLEIDILRNSSQKILGVLRSVFSGFGCPKRHPDTLLAKTMTTIFNFLLDLVVKCQYYVDQVSRINAGITVIRTSKKSFILSIPTWSPL